VVANIMQLFGCANFFQIKRKSVGIIGLEDFYNIKLPLTAVCLKTHRSKEYLKKRKN
jgi:hypothetical protein